MDTEINQHKVVVADAFGRAAASYDQIGPRFFSYFGQRLVEAVDIVSGAKVLDVASGRGASLFPAAAAVGAAGEAVGIDLAAGMTEATNREIAWQGLTNVRALTMDGEQLDFAAASFDYVLCGFGMFFFPHPVQAMAEFHRVLKRGGRLAISTWGAGDERWNWLEQLPRPAGPPPYWYTNTRQHAFDQPEGMSKFVQAAGFVHPAVTTVSADLVYANAEQWLAVQWSHGGRLGLEQLSAAELAQAGQIAFERIAAIAGPDGVPQRMTAILTVAEKP